MGIDYSQIHNIQNVNALQSLQAGQLGMVAHNFARKNALDALISDNADDLMTGDANALAALAGHGTAGLDMARGIQQEGITNARADRQEARLDRQFKLQLSEALRNAITAQIKAERDELIGKMRQLAVVHAEGNPARFDAATLELEADGITFDNFPMAAAEFEEVHPLYTSELERRAGAGQSAAEQKIARLMETGLDRDTAIGIVDGRVTTTRDPITGEAQLIDKASGQIISGPPQPSISVPNGPLATPAQAQPTTQQAAPEIDLGMPDDTDFRTATGVGGLLRQLANTGADAFGADLPFRNNEEATQAMDNLATQTMTVLASGVAGRPSNYLLEQFERMASRPNSVWQGPGRTREKLNQTRAFVGEAIALNQQVLASGVSPTLKSEAQANIARLQQLFDSYSQVIDSFGSRTTNGNNTTDSGVQWRIVE